MKNSDFLRVVYGALGEGEFGWVCAFRANPNSADADWSGRMFSFGGFSQSFIDDAARAADNCYFSTAVLTARDDDGKPRRTKGNLQRLAALVADDCHPSTLLGTATWVNKTSTGKYQAGCAIDPADCDAADSHLVHRLMQEMARLQFVPADKSGNNAVRYCRLISGTNTKTGEAVELVTWNPEQVMNLADAASVFGIDLDTLRQPAATSAPVTRQAAEAGADWAELIDGFTRPDLDQRAYHDSLLRFTGKLAAAGTSAGAIVNLTRTLMDATRPGSGAELARWQHRWEEVPRMAQEAARKFAPASQAVSINLPLAGSQAATEASKLLLSISELRTASASIRWLVKNVIPADSMGILFGASGTYKSFLSLDLALHVAHGIDWVGARTKQGPVVYCAAEGGAGISRRVQAWHQEQGLVETDQLLVCTTPLVLSEQAPLQQLIAAIDQLPEPPAVIIIDTLSQSSNIDENDATEVAAFIRNINAELRVRYHCTVLLVHHTGHVATERPRGSSVLTANMDFLLSCVRPDVEAQSCILETVKQKDGDKRPPMLFDLHRQSVGVDEDGEEISSLVAVHNGATVAFVQRLKLGKYDKVILASLEEAGAAVPEIALRQRIVTMCGNAETGRKSFQRAMGTLREQRLITETSPGMWAAAQKKGPP